MLHTRRATILLNNTQPGCAPGSTLTAKDRPAHSLTDVIDLLVVRDDLRLGLLRVHVPDGARGVDACGTQQTRVLENR